MASKSRRFPPSPGSGRVRKFQRRFLAAWSAGPAAPPHTTLPAARRPPRSARAPQPPTLHVYVHMASCSGGRPVSPRHSARFTPSGESAQEPCLASTEATGPAWQLLTESGGPACVNSALLEAPRTPPLFSALLPASPNLPACLIAHLIGLSGLGIHTMRADVIRPRPQGLYLI